MKTNPTGVESGAAVFSRKECIFSYCPHPVGCQNSCRNPYAKPAAKPAQGQAIVYHLIKDGYCKSCDGPCKLSQLKLAEAPSNRRDRILTVANHVGLTEDQVKRFIGCLLMVGLELHEVDPEGVDEPAHGEPCKLQDNWCSVHKQWRVSYCKAVTEQLAEGGLIGENNQFGATPEELERALELACTYHYGTLSTSAYFRFPTAKAVEIVADGLALRRQLTTELQTSQGLREECMKLGLMVIGREDRAEKAEAALEAIRAQPDILAAVREFETAYREVVISGDDLIAAGVWAGVKRVMEMGK